MRLSTTTLAAFIAASCAVAADARTWHVRLDGSGDIATLPAAVAAAADYDTILVGPGVYTWTNQNPDPTDYFAMLQFDAGKEYVTLLSEAGPEATVIDAEWAGRVIVTKNQNYLTVDGFTIRGGFPPVLAPTQGGGGLFLHVSHDVFKNCIIRDNYATNGAGAWVGGLSQPLFIDCEFRDNHATSGGAMYLVSTTTKITLRRCRFHHNDATNAGGALYMARSLVDVDESTFAFNQAPMGGAVFMSSMWAATVTRCTFVGNGGAQSGSLHVLASPGILIQQSIVSYGTEGPPYHVSSNSAVTLSCTNTFRNPVSDDLPPNAIDGGDNFSADPLYCGPVDSMDYTVALGSPCLPGNHPQGAACGAVGAFGQGCAPSPVETRTWGRIKAMYRPGNNTAERY